MKDSILLKSIFLIVIFLNSIVIIAQEEERKYSVQHEKDKFSVGSILNDKHIYVFTSLGLKTLTNTGLQIERQQWKKLGFTAEVGV